MTKKRAVEMSEQNEKGPAHVIHPLNHAQRLEIAKTKDSCGSYYPLVFAHDRLFGIAPLFGSYAVLKHKKRIANSVYGSLLSWLNPRLRLAEREGLLRVESACHEPDCFENHFAHGYSTSWSITPHHTQLLVSVMQFMRSQEHESQPFHQMRRFFTFITYLHDSIHFEESYDSTLQFTSGQLSTALRIDLNALRQGQLTASQAGIDQVLRYADANKKRSKLRLIKGGLA